VTSGSARSAGQQHGGMRNRLLHAPAWVLALVNGGTFGLWWVLYTRLIQEEGWTEALVSGGLLGLFFGAVMGPVLHRQNRGVREVAARSPEGLSRQVRRAASRGPVPAEPEVRRAAHELALAQLEPMERQRAWGPPFFLLMAALAVGLAVTGTGWWWAGAALFAAMAAGHRYQLVRLRRRAALLEPDAG
jgi:hypothetical protein